jgi:hypothetical protein
MLELPILAIFATCIFGMIKYFPFKRKKQPIVRPIWERENGKQEIEVWLTGFLAELKRNSTRTQKCRLISSLERMKFEDDADAVWWKYVRFEEDEAEIFDKDKRSLEKIKITKFQKNLLTSSNMLKHQLIFRSEIKEESGKWKVSDNSKTKIISEGGEALVLSEKFEDLETAVRVQIFDPFLFTKDFGFDSLTWKIHFQKKGKF